MRAHKWKYILCVLVSVAGFALGIALFCISNYGWWYYNRCSFAGKIINTSFAVLAAFIFGGALMFLMLTLCSMLRQTHFLAYAVDLVTCLYCGATTAAVFVCSVMWGVLFAVFVSLEWLAAVCFACFACVCEKPMCRNFCEAARDIKQSAIALAVGVLYKIIALFVILKLLTALIWLSNNKMFAIITMKKVFLYL